MPPEDASESPLALRLALHEYGFEPVAVSGKAPVSDGWQSGAITTERIAKGRSALHLWRLKSGP
jgi:hypothetical protein